MNKDRKEYYRNYRLNHKEQYRKYNRKYRENNLTTYDRLKQENNILHRKVNKCIELLRIGVLTYNNGGSRKGLFEVIEECLEVLE